MNTHLDILTIIKNRRTIRKYHEKSISQGELDKIIEAGIWGPSLLAPGFQPWKFIIIKDKILIKKIGDILLKKSQMIGIGGNAILHVSANTIYNTQTLIAIYNTFALVRFAERIKKKACVYYAKSAELCAISAAIQNMILTAESLGIGSCWLDTPLFCEKEINKLLNTEDKLVAVLTLGYPAEEGRRAPRKPISEMVKYI